MVLQNLGETVYTRAMVDRNRVNYRIVEKIKSMELQSDESTPW